MKQWEYLAGRLHGEFSDRLSYHVFDGLTETMTFHELGILGWELVAANDNIAYFKRELNVVGIYDVSEALDRWGTRKMRDEMEGE